MAIPNTKPGGGNFPVFNGASAPNFQLQTWENGERIILVQFDFSSPNGMQQLMDASGNLYRAFIVDFSSIGGQQILKPFRSLLLSVDFNPTHADLSAFDTPFNPIQIADSLSGQLLYAGSNLGGTWWNGTIFQRFFTTAKVSAAFPIIQRPNTQVMFSQQCYDTNAGGKWSGAGTAIFTQREIPPFVSQTT